MSLVEFCGFPGSGKSTVGRLLVDCLRASGDDVLDRLDADEHIQSRYVGSTSLGTAAEALGYGLKRPAWARSAWAVARRSRSRRTVRSIIRVQNQLRTSLAFGTTHQLILDEWFIHQVWLATIDSHHVTVPDVQHVLRGISAALSEIPRLVVRLTVSPSVAATRVLSRADVTSFDTFSHAELQQMLVESHESLDVLCRTSCEQSAFLVFDTTAATPREVVEQLLPHVRALR